MSGLSPFQENVRINIDAAIEYIEECKAEAAHWTEKLQDEVTANIRNAQTEDDRLQYAAYVYWLCPQVEAETVYRALNVKRGELAKILPKISMSAKCKDCDVVGTVYPKTRSEMKEIQRGKHNEVCPKCTAIRKARSNAYSLEVARKRAEQESELERLKTMPYLDYLKSDHWKSLRSKMLNRASFSCQLCNSKGRLNVHHRTYERRGCEEYSDLIVLCEHCHSKFHDKLEGAS